jgi:sugar phosphate isomerases/epimerases
MQLGICLTIGDDIDELKKIKNDGADYIETGLWDLGNLSGDQIAEKFENLNRAGLSCPALNGFCRKDLKLTGPDFDKSALSEYTNKMFEKVSNHVKHITIGSGASRTVPEGFKKEEAREQLLYFFKYIASPAAQKYGITIGIEALNSDECNIFTSHREVFDAVKSINENNIKMIVDYYHFMKEKEPLESISDYEGYISHFHIAGLNNGRKNPLAEDAGEEYSWFINAVKKYGGDNARCSLECGIREPFHKNLSDSFNYLRNL